MPGLFSHNGLLGGRISGKALEVGVCITAASGFLLFGYDQGEHPPCPRSYDLPPTDT